MKHFNRFHLGLLPLLSILAMSPSVIETQFAQRSIASVEQEVVIENPRYQAMVEKVKPESLLKDDSLDIVKLKAKSAELKEKITTSRSGFQITKPDEKVTLEQRTLVESLVIESLLVDMGIKQISEKEVDKASELEEDKKSLSESKAVLESIIVDLEKNEAIVAESKLPKVEDKPVIADGEEPKKEEPKVEEKPVIADKEEPKAEEKPVVVVVDEPKKEEPKKEEPKKEEVVTCDHDDKNQVVNKQMEQLLADQNKIMQTMLNMTQMMMGMMQQQQQNQMPNPYYANGNGFQIQNPYQYNQPFTSGNWVYMPNGQQMNGPSQPNINIFTQSAPQQQMGGFYPDQMHGQGQGQSNWNLRPQMNFGAQGDQRFNNQPVSYGSFGDNAFTYQMSSPAPSFQS